MATVDVNLTLDAPIEAVFEHLVDHARYETFEGVRGSVLVREGTDERNGEGAQRKITLAATTLWEDIVGFARPTLLEYKIVRARPPLVRHVLGRVALEDVGGQTKVRWTSEFYVRLPVVRRIIEPKLVKAFHTAFTSMLREIERRVNKA